ncbi:hypothetical protein ES703_19338 [subsurface metagenome]
MGSLWDDARVERYIRLYSDPREKKGSQSILCKDAAEMIEGEQVLDVGCGMGHLCPFVKPTRYFGVDSSPTMLAKAREFFPDREFNLLEATEMELPSTFDTTIAISLLIHLTAEQGHAVLKRMWKHTRKAMVFGMETMKSSEIRRPDGLLIRTQSLPELIKELEGMGISRDQVSLWHHKWTYSIQYTVTPSLSDSPLSMTGGLIQRTTLFKVIK